jgi:uncharacterized protein YodC (DUF2158 family)
MKDKDSSMIVGMPIGTRVRLASGGPVMLIVENLPGCRVTCAWTGQDGRPIEDDFLVVCLDIIRRTHIVNWRRK